MERTIRRFICENEARQRLERAESLAKIGAPAVMIDGCKREAERLTAGELEISGDASLLDEVVESFEVRKGKGGKPYVSFNGTINYFPVAKYGRYITVAK